jgi:hypothetical protein
MVKKRGKPISFDAMVKFFMKSYEIPTRRDVEKILLRLERFENLIRTHLDTMQAAAKDGDRSKSIRKKSSMTATDLVMEVVTQNKQGVTFNKIQSSTGFDAKKIRNIIYRMDKLGKITRKSRGIYISTQP